MVAGVDAISGPLGIPPEGWVHFVMSLVTAIDMAFTPDAPRVAGDVHRSRKIGF
jgi:hypothetical protein